MSATKYDITIEEGATFFLTLTFQDGSGEPLDISEWTFEGAIKTDPTQAEAVAEFAFDLSDGADGKLHIEIAAEDTAGLSNMKQAETYVYDIYATRTDNKVLRPIYGLATVYQGVSR